MQKFVLSLALATLVATTATAQMKPNAGATTKVQRQTSNMSIETADRITIPDAHKLMNSGKVVFVDVRSKEQYNLGHIKGAISIPGSQLIARLRDIPPGKRIITYCACSADQSAAKAVLELNGHGVKNSVALKGGWNQWLASGLPTEITRR